MQLIPATALARLPLLRLLLLLIIALPATALAQTNLMAEWETLRPEGEEFTILIPKNSTVETSKEPYHKMELNTRLYLWTNPTGPVFAVGSLSGIKANPALYSEAQRLNSYVDAFKRWFPQKVRGKEAVAKLVLANNTTVNGHAGREYKMSIADLSGTMQVYATRKRFYAVVYLNTKTDEAIQKQFLSSFELPEYVIESPKATVTAQKVEQLERPLPQPDQELKKPDAATPAAEGETEKTAVTKTSEPPPTGGRAPISGGVLNGKATSLPVPEYPASARQARASGTVVVQVTIDEYGNVTVAKAVSGHLLLQQASVTAAQQAKFAPTFFMGEPVKVSGVITFNFAAP